MAFLSALSTPRAPSLFRIWVVEARLVCKCARPTLRRRSLPVPVTEIRLTAAFLVFILLMVLSRELATRTRKSLILTKLAARFKF